MCEDCLVSPSDPHYAPSVDHDWFSPRSIISQGRLGSKGDRRARIDGLAIEED